MFTGSYTQNAVWYSGLPDAMNGENGQVNGNGQPMFMADAFFNPLTNQWSTPTAWSVCGLIEHHWTPTFYTDLEGSVGGLKLEQHERQLLRLAASAPASSRPTPSPGSLARTLAGTRSPT